MLSALSEMGYGTLSRKNFRRLALKSVHFIAFCVSWKRPTEAGSSSPSIIIHTIVILETSEEEAWTAFLSWLRQCVHRCLVVLAVLPFSRPHHALHPVCPSIAIRNSIVKSSESSKWMRKWPLSKVIDKGYLNFDDQRSRGQHYACPANSRLISHRAISFRSQIVKCQV